MNLSTIRFKKGFSQRRLARLAGVSFGSVQLIESGKHDPQLSTLQKIATSLGFPKDSIKKRIEDLFQTPTESIAVISQQIAAEGEASWKGWMFDFVDAFRTTPGQELIQSPPAETCPPKIKALLASTVEALCEEKGVTIPEWCEAVPILSAPWFISGVESLKPSALVESPTHFRKRNIFVLENFLRRA